MQCEPFREDVPEVAEKYKQDEYDPQTSKVKWHIDNNDDNYEDDDVNEYNKYSQINLQRSKFLNLIKDDNRNNDNTSNNNNNNTQNKINKEQKGNKNNKETTNNNNNTNSYYGMINGMLGFAWNYGSKIITGTYNYVSSYIKPLSNTVFPEDNNNNNNNEDDDNYYSNSINNDYSESFLHSNPNHNN